MKQPTIRELVDEFLRIVYGGTAHPHRRQVLDEFVEWAGGRDREMEDAPQRGQGE